MRRDYKIKFTDNLKANLWIHLDLAKVHRLKKLNSPYIISYLHFVNFFAAEATFNLTRLMFALFFACQIYTHVLVYKIKTNASHLVEWFNLF